MTFNFNARYALLTYAQSGTLDPWAVVDHFTELRAECIVSREAHADGGTHLHCFVDFARKFRSRRADVFDVSGCHPNVSPTHTTPQAGFDYACKDGDIVAGGLGRPDASKVPRDGDCWHDIVAAESREEFFRLLLELAPKQLCCSFTQLEKYAEWRYRPAKHVYRHPEGFQLVQDMLPELTEWLQQLSSGPGRGKWPDAGGIPPEIRFPADAGTPPPYLRAKANIFIDGKRGQSLCLWGPSRNGKTIWARAHGPHAYFGGLFSLDENLDGVQYAVFDDINGGIQFFPQYKWWLGHQHQFYATDKYKGKRLIHWGKPAIWVSNNDPREEHGADRDWLNANVKFVYIDTPLTIEL